MIASMIIRLLLCFIILIIYDLEDSNFQIERKLSIVAFTLPYYFFLMVFSSILFSAHTFYVSLHLILFPHLKAKDDHFKGVNINKSTSYFSSKNCFLCLQVLVCVLLTTFTACIMSKHDEGGSKKFSTFDKVLLWTCDTILYLIQVLVLGGSIFIFCRLRNLSKEKASCELCPDTDS